MKHLSIRRGGALLMALFAILIFVIFRRQTSYPETPKLDTRIWGMARSPISNILVVKLDANGDLLLGRVIDDRDWNRDIEPSASSLSTTVLRYSQQTKTPEVTDRDTWTTAEGRSWHDGSLPDSLDYLKDRSWVNSDPNTRRTLKFRGNPVGTAGRKVIQSAPSPDGKLMAVLSADGISEGGIVFSASISGGRYHEVFRLATGEHVGKAVKLSDPGNADTIAPTWSPDSKYVVYSDGPYALWIVPVESEK